MTAKPDLARARQDMREEFTLAQTLRIDRLIQAHIAYAVGPRSPIVQSAKDENEALSGKGET